MSEKWNEIRKTGVLAFVLSLPILIWNSIKAGKTIHWITFAMFMFWFAGRASDVVFTKFINRWEIKNESVAALSEIKKLKSNIADLSRLVSGADSEIKKRIDEKVDSIISANSARIDRITEALDGFQRAAEVVRESERASLKDRIVELREQVLLKKKDINSAVIRKEFETLIEHMNLLTDEEKGRFKKDLEDMGFYVEKVKNRMNMYRGGVYYGGGVSLDVGYVSDGPIASMARVYVRGDDGD